MVVLCSVASDGCQRGVLQHAACWRRLGEAVGLSPHAEAGLLLPGLEQWGFSAEVLGSCCCGLQSMSAGSLSGGRGTSSGLSVPRRVGFAIPMASGLSDGGSQGTVSDAGLGSQCE